MNAPTSPYHHGDLREALLRETGAMIADSGVDGVTMRALSARLGVSRTAPYRHFPDKSALLVAVAAMGFERLRERLQAVQAGDPGSSLERFRRLGEEYVHFALENRGYYRLMYGREALTRDEVPELGESAGALLALLVDSIRAHQRSGSIKDEDPEVLAYAAWSAVHGLASLLIEGQIQPKVEVDQLVRQTTRTLLDGLRAEPT